MNAETSRNKRLRIMLADDHAIFSEALRGLLEKGYEIVGSVKDGRALLKQAPLLHPDLIVMDISMPLLNGLDAARRIRAILPTVKIVFLTMQNDPNLAAAASTLGNVGFVLKGSSFSELQTAIEAVCQNKAYITPRLRAEDWAVSIARARQFSKDLSDRQKEIVQLLAEGFSAKEIGAQLNLSERTVTFHKYNIMNAFNLKSNAELVVFAIKRGLLLLRQDD